MENGRIKTIDELNESFIRENKANVGSPIPVTYDGEALVNAVCGAVAKDGPGERSYDISPEILPEFRVKRGGFGSFVKAFVFKLKAGNRLRNNWNSEKLFK